MAEALEYLAATFKVYESTKSEFRNSKWFDMLTTLLVLSGVEGSNVEGETQNSNDQMTKTKTDRRKGFYDSEPVSG